MKRIRKRFVHPNRDQILLLPPDLGEWVNENHFAKFLVGVLEQLDFSAFYAAYEGVESGETPGRPPYSPDLMVGLIFYSMTRGALSSRAMEETAYSDIGARYLTGDIQPDHACIARFRLRHQAAIRNLFSQIVLLCHRAGLVSLRHVSLDSTTCQANVAANSSINVEKLPASWRKAQERANRLVELWATADKEDEALRAGLKRQGKEAQGRADRIKEAIEFIKAEKSKMDASGRSQNSEEQGVHPECCDAEDSIRTPQQVGEKIRAARLAKSLPLTELARRAEVDRRRICDIESGHRRPNETLRESLSALLDIPVDELYCPRVPKTPKNPKTNRINITDRDCYLTYKPQEGYTRGYLGQVAVDSKHQMVLDAVISPKNTDQDYPSSFVRNCAERLGDLPDLVSADTGYTSITNIEMMEMLGVDYLTRVSSQTGKSPLSHPKITAMRERIESPEGKRSYGMRSAIVEPVFSRLESQLGFRRFLYRGIEKVGAEWMLMQTAYNLMRWFAVANK